MRNTMRYWLPTLFVLMLAGCVSTKFIPEEIASGIPEGSNTIEVSSDSSTAHLYRQLYLMFASKGFPFLSENEEMGSFTTGPYEIEQQTTLVSSVFVEENGTGSKAALRPHWGVTSEMAVFMHFGTGVDVDGVLALQNRAVWGDTGRNSVAFGKLAMMVNELDGVSISYREE